MQAITIYGDTHLDEKYLSDPIIDFQRLGFWRISTCITDLKVSGTASMLQRAEERHTSSRYLRKLSKGDMVIVFHEGFPRTPRYEQAPRGEDGSLNDIDLLQLFIFGSNGWRDITKAAGATEFLEMLWKQQQHVADLSERHVLIRQRGQLTVMDVTTNEPVLGLEDESSIEYMNWCVDRVGHLVAQREIYQSETKSLKAWAKDVIDTFLTKWV